MSSLRILGFSYLTAASLFMLAILFSDHASLRMVTNEAVQSVTGKFQSRVMAPMLSFARLEDEKTLDPQVSVRLSPPGPNDAPTLTHAQLPPIPAKKIIAPALAPSQPTIIMPDLPDSGDGEGYGTAPPPLPNLSKPETLSSLAPPEPQGDSALGPVERAAVTSELAQNLTPEMRKNFDLFLYVSKASKGPLAQRLYVFKKDSGGALAMTYDWAASTGREKYEISPVGLRARTVTPAGFYQLDPGRMFRAYHSYAWDQSMPFAMFFNREVHGDQTGLAIHAAVGDDIAKLGSRASAGCVHLSPAHAQLLFDLIRADYRGKAPRFAYDRASRTMSNDGQLMRDAKGDLVMADGYRVLIDIEDFSGAGKVAALN